MSFNTLFQHISTFITIYLTEIIKTENRMLDTAYIGLLSFLILETINYIRTNWIETYNWIIYYVYKMDENPFDIKRAPYIERKYCAYSDYIKLYTNIHNSKHIIPYLRIELQYCNFREILLPFLHKNQKMVQPVYFPDKRKELNSLNNDIKDGIFLICFERGVPIYYNTSTYYSSFGEFHCSPVSEMEKILKKLAYFINKDYDKSSENRYLLFPKILSVPREKYNCDLGYTYTLEFKNISEISKKKTFDSLFYTQKDEIIKILDKFREGKLYPEHIPMDNKLGILLYGPPGTGKTGTISAIANYLQRNIILINFTSITSTNELDLIIDKSRHRQNIYVFDEFDCVLDVISQKAENEKKDWGKLLLAAGEKDKGEIINMMKEEKKKVKIDLAYLLQKLDGLESAQDRLIIATTNNPDKINPVLLRPGRFDLKICLGNCTQDMYGKILENFYKNEKDVYNRVLQKNIPEFKYSPLEVINKAITCESLNTLLDELK